MLRIGPVLLLPFALAACNAEPVSGPGSQRDGRYIGVGIYAAGDLWQRIAGAARSDNAQAARLRDDDHVIVVVDSHTGEIRQCGNLSGHCIRMNPWSGEATPTNLTAHAEDIDREESAGDAGDVVNNAAAADPVNAR